jgi:CPA2 family monovalent cation:H+ antiporter-2
MVELPFLPDLVVILVLSLAVGLIFQRLRQPVLVGFLAAGVVLGPHGLSLIRDVREVERLAEVGVVLLLFSLGLEFSLAALVQLRRQVLLGGGLQVGLTMLLATLLMLGLDGWRQAALLGGLVALSSTAIALKLLVERGELDAPHGRAALGILLLQDLLVIPMMLAVPLLAGTAQPEPGRGAWAFVMALTLVGLLLVAARWVIPRGLAAVARTRHRELFVLTLLLICLGTAWLTSRAGLSLALGAFLAGVAVSESEYGAQALADVVPLRDTFTSLFFVSIGMLLDVRFVLQHPLPLIAAVVAVLALKLLTGMAAVCALGLGLRTGLLGGFAVAQVGEFSFVLAQAGVAHRLLDADRYQWFLGVAVTTMFATPFLFGAARALADRWAPHLPARLRAERTPPSPTELLRDHVVIAGYGLNGRNLARVLRAVAIPYVIVDITPERIWAARAAGEPVIYGDVGRQEVLEHLGLDRARALVLAISDAPSTRRAVALARATWPRLVIIARTRYLAEVDALDRLGATEVIPEELETSIEIFARVLATYDVPRSLIAQQIEQVRREHYAVWREADLEGPRRARLHAMVPGLDVDTYRVTDTSLARGQCLAELDLHRAAGVSVIARVRDGVVLTNPGGDVALAPGDVLVLLGTNAQLERARARLEAG